MSGDIVDNLRTAWKMPYDNITFAMWLTWMGEAADEIDRLRRIVPGGASTVGSDKWREVMRHAPQFEVVTPVDEKTAREIAEEKAIAAIARIEEVASRRR